MGYFVSAIYYYYWVNCSHSLFKYLAEFAQEIKIIFSSVPYILKTASAVLQGREKKNLYGIFPPNWHLWICLHLSHQTTYYKRWHIINITEIHFTSGHADNKRYQNHYLSSNYSSQPLLSSPSFTTRSEGQGVFIWRCLSALVEAFLTCFKMPSHLGRIGLYPVRLHQCLVDFCEIIPFPLFRRKSSQQTNLQKKQIAVLIHVDSYHSLIWKSLHFCKEWQGADKMPVSTEYLML